MKKNVVPNRTGDAVPRKLKCLGHYGYADGWYGGSFCPQCPLVSSCTSKALEVGEGVPLRRIQVAEALYGREDRLEGLSRYTGEGREVKRLGDSND